jgi:AraC-like DNA-binding protein
VATAPPESAGSEDPIRAHLAVLAAGVERFGDPREVDRPRGAGFVIVCATMEGSGWVRLHDTVHRAPAGTVFLLPADVSHAYGTETLPWTIWWMDIGGADAADLLRASGASHENPVVSPHEFAQVVDALEGVLRCLERGGRADGVEAAGRAWRLMSILAADRFTPRRADPAELAMTWIADRLDRELTVADVAAAVGLSPSRLMARFRAVTGGGVIAYQTELRMTQARRMLDGSDDHVAEIAHAIGYDDPYYFSRVFRRVHSMTPTDFRRRPRP